MPRRLPPASGHHSSPRLTAHAVVGAALLAHEHPERAGARSLRRLDRPAAWPVPRRFVVADACVVALPRGPALADSGALLPRCSPGSRTERISWWTSPSCCRFGRNVLPRGQEQRDSGRRRASRPTPTRKSAAFDFLSNIQGSNAASGAGPSATDALRAAASTQSAKSGQGPAQRASGARHEPRKRSRRRPGRHPDGQRDPEPR